MSDESNRVLAGTLLTLAGGLALNSILGPLLADVITYPFSETLVNQTMGLEAVTLVLVAPWCVVAALLVLRGNRIGPLLAIPPSAHTAYMFVQYVVGPQYTASRSIIVIHLVIFVLSGVTLVLAWNGIRADALPDMSRRPERYAGIGVLLLAAFAFAQYVFLIGGSLSGAQLAPEGLADPTMFWSIFFLDLGIVEPVTLEVGMRLLRGRDWAQKPAYGVVGWFVLVPISVWPWGSQCG